jgi:hypothetical protein
VLPVSTHLAYAFECSSNLLYHRLDLAYALSNLSKPLFVAGNDISWKSYLPSSTPVLETTATAPHLLIGDSESDPKLINVWHDLYEISRAANIATQTGQKLQLDLLQDVMISVQYRLLHLQYDNNDTHELLRIVMLIYSTTILPPLLSLFGAAGLSYPSLPDCLQGFLITLDLSSNQKLEALLWLLVIIKMKVSDNEFTAHQLAQTVQALNLSSWDELLVVLKRHLWIDVLHKNLVTNVFDNI